jgi:hypothetical protein
MSAVDALDLARLHGVVVEVRGDRPHLQAPKAPPPEVVKAIRCAKPRPGGSAQTHPGDCRDTGAAHGYRRVHIVLRREGWPVNVNRVRRLYCLEGLKCGINRPAGG